MSIVLNCRLIGPVQDRTVATWMVIYLEGSSLEWMIFRERIHLDEGSFEMVSYSSEIKLIIQVAQT